MPRLPEKIGCLDIDTPYLTLQYGQYCWWLALCWFLTHSSGDHRDIALARQYAIHARQSYNNMLENIRAGR